jgi:hypothetical protein
MTEAQPTLAHGDEYIVIYSGGPNDGQIETRISTDGGFDSEITVGDKYHVTYAFDAKDSEPFDAPEDRGDRQ